MLSAKQIEAAAVAAAHSLWITTLAVAVALLTGAQHVGATDTPRHFLLYVHVNWFTAVCTVLTAMSIRASIAAHQTKGQSS